MSSELTGYPVSSLGIDMFSELTGLIDSLGVTYIYYTYDRQKITDVGSFSSPRLLPF